MTALLLPSLNLLTLGRKLYLVLNDILVIDHVLMEPVQGHVWIGERLLLLVSEGKLRDRGPQDLREGRCNRRLRGKGHVGRVSYQISSFNLILL